MLVVSDKIKESYNKYTTQRKSYIKVGDNSFFVQNVDLYADAYDEGNIVGNAIAKILKFDIETEYVRGLDEFELFDGIWTGNEYEYISLGTFKLFEEQGKDDFFSSITSYDKLILFNIVYNPLLTEYPTTIYGLLQNICEQAGVELETTTIANGDKVLNENLFVENETLKDILRAICEISGNYALISNDKLKLQLKGKDTITLEKYQLSNSEYKRTTWKINQIVLGMKDIEGEYVQKQDDEDVDKNGIHKVVINNNPFVYTQELRQEYIDELFEAVRGFGYIAYETEWEGLPYFELGDLLNIDGKESLVLRYELKSPNGLDSTLSAPSIIDSVIDYIDNTNDLNNQMMRTEYIVDKHEGQINQLTTKTNTLEDGLGNTYTIEQTNELIQNSATGVTNTFSEAGGNNIFRNTGLWYENENDDREQNPYEFWNGKVIRNKNDNAQNMRSLLLQNGSLSQEQEVSNGNYTVSFKYKKDISLANFRVVINGLEYVLDSDEEGTFITGVDDINELQVTTRHIKVEFITDIDNSVEVYDLMVNAGKVKLAYSQNQNETTTDTVNISKGITITSTNTDTTFKANADGIRTLDKSGNRLTEFTDTGMVTKRAEIEEEAEIVGVIIKEVNNQTWITRL